MSSYQFLASDKPFEKLENHYLMRLSIKEALERNMDVPEFMLDNPDVDQDEKVFLVCEEEDHLHDLEIYPEDNPTLSTQISITEKPYTAEIYWQYSSEQVEVLLSYIRSHMEKAHEVEIYSLWLDEVETAEKEVISLDTLSPEKLYFLDDNRGYNGPRCLLIKKTPVR